MLLSEFNYTLPERLIAKEPVTPRDHSKLLVVNRHTGELSHRRFFELPELIDSGDCLVRNTSRVIPARLPTLNAADQPVEVFLLKKVSGSSSRWQCLVKPGKRVKENARLQLKDGSWIEVLRIGDSFEVVLPEKESFWSWLDTVGEPPLPPYLKREVTASDYEKYQTVYSSQAGSIAAPTAGLHFTDELIDRLTQQKVQFADVVLHVGYGTFSPIRSAHVEDHAMHFETYSIPPVTLERVKNTRAAGKKVIAVGTTSVRTLESQSILGSEGETNLYITPGYEFKEIDGLITNFHLPQSTLYVLVASLLGLELCRKAYETAIAQEYRFFSYGDAMLIL